jgi:signal peptide peptidase SppA
MRAFEAALSAAWAMDPERLEELLAIAAREHDATPEALEAYRAQALARADRATRRGNVAILYATGPLFKRANLITEFSGASSYDVLRRDLQTAIDDPSIASALLFIDSPGGEASGVDELASAIYAMRGKKPIHAYVSGQGASAAYWLASAADKIYLSEASMVGSIGVIMGVSDTSKRDAANGVKTVQFVSSQSPDKRPDVNTDAGRAKVQAIVDALAEVFVNSVATFRGVDAKTVLEKFGQGSVLVGTAAVAAGMADGIGSFESVLEALSSNGGSNRTQRSGGIMSTTGSPPAANSAGTVTQTDHDAAVAAARLEGAKAERARIQAIVTSDEAKANPGQASYLAYETDMDPVIAKGILAKAAPAATAPVADPAAAYADARVSATADLATPKTPPATAARQGWSDAVSETNARRGKTRF